MALMVILLVAVCLRLISAFYQGDTITDLPGVHDQLSYDTLAQRLLDGHGFSFAADWWPATRAGEPTAHWSHLYTLYLAAVHALFGYHPLAARLIQSVAAGVLHPWLIWRIGRRVFGPEVGLIAAALTAVYAYFVFYSAALVTETFYILAILWVLDLATGMIRGSTQGRESWNTWLLLGIALGTAALLRQVIVLFVPFLLAWLWWVTCRTGKQKTSGMVLSSFLWGGLLTIVVMSAMIAPWTVRNYRTFDRFVPLNTNSGYAFFWGNHPIHGKDFKAILPSQGPSYWDLIPPRLRKLDEAALDQALMREGLRFVIEDPLRYVLLSLSRVKEYFKFWPSSRSSSISNLARVMSFGVCLPFMILGLWLSVTYTGCSKAPASLGAKVELQSFDPQRVLLYLFIASYSLIHLLSWALIRYRLPVDSVLILFAALGLLEFLRRLSAPRRLRQIPAANAS